MAIDYMRWVDRNWPLLTRVIKGHTMAYRATHGLVGYRFPGAPPALLLDHVGARSGKRYTTPLVFGRDGSNVILVASKGGHPKHPAWFHNLQANPDVSIQIGSKRMDMRARVATAEERERLWSLMVGVYRGYEGYRQRTEREIPLVVLEPR
jgi:F420H(2)-dependent quinone reductase